MPLIEIQVVPLGTSSTSLSRYVAEAVKAIKELGYEPEIHPFGTVVAIKDLEEIGRIIKHVHERLVKLGVKRIATYVKIDDRRDKEVTSKQKVESVLSKLK